MKTFLLTLLFLFSTTVAVLNAAGLQQKNDSSYYELRGRVWGEDTREPLVYASVSVRNSNISTVTNQDGYFSIKVPLSAKNSQLIIRHLGYRNKIIPIITLIDRPNDYIMMQPYSILLEEVEVVSGDGGPLVREALLRIPENYPDVPNMMVAFYRESIKKRNTYISLVEAVVDIYKASYRSFENDQARIYIGRRATDINPRDTILLKFQGGITSSLMLDVAKNPEIVFGKEGEEYIFNIENMVYINEKPNYVISFVPRPDIEEILFRGKIYLDANSLAFTRMEFNMNVEGRKDASRIFIKKKPAKMKVDMHHAGYIVDYVERDHKWYFNYSRTDVAFKVNWSHRFFGLFAPRYTITSEIAITDRYTDDVVKFPRSERIRSTDIIAEKVEDFQDSDFWGEYNVIEPDAEISAAIKKLSDKLRRRQQ